MVKSRLSNDAGGWETVKGRKGDKKKQEEPAVKKQVSALQATPAASTVVENGFDALVEKEVAPAAVDKPTGKAAGSDVDTPGTPPQSQEQNSTMASSLVKSSKGKGKKDKKKTKKKGKDNKSASSLISEGIQLPNLEDIIKDVEAKYPGNVAAQIESVTDELLPAFKQVLDLAAVIQKKPYKETITIADGLMSSHASDILSGFLAKKPVPGVSEALCVFLRALFESCEGANGCKEQAGVVIMVSMIAKSSPVSVVRAMEQLVFEGARFTSPTRIPLLHWVFGQAERGACGASLACWLRLMLPQLLGSPLKDPTAQKKKSKKKTGVIYRLEKKSADLAAFALDCALNGGMGTFVMSGAVQKAGNVGLAYASGTSEMKEPLVSFASYEKVLNLIRKPMGIPEKIVQTLVALSPLLNQMIFSPSFNDPAALQGVVPLALALAGKSDSDNLSSGDSIVSSAANALITCLQLDSECFEVWAVNHKSQIKGSCRILQHLAQTHPKEFVKMMKDPSTRESFLVTMRELQERHGFLLAEDKGWQTECAKGAHEATKIFLDIKSRPKGSRSISTKAVFLICILTGITSALVMSHLDEITDVILNMMDSPAGQKMMEFIKDGIQLATQFQGYMRSTGKEIGLRIRDRIYGDQTNT